MRFEVRGGKDEIGGMCIEVAADDGTRILLDLGMRLYDDEGNDYPFDTPQRPTAELISEGVLPRGIAGLYGTDPASPGISAIFITHSHADHYGLAHHAHSAIPVYGSRGTVAMLTQVGRVFFPDAKIPKDLKELPSPETVQVGSLCVSALEVDHSAPDSRAYLVEGDGQRLLFTGDFRAHGRTGYRFTKLLRDPRVHGVDWLLHEATTMGHGGTDHGMASELAVENALLKLACEVPAKIVVVVSSGQNVDRLISCYKAAYKSGRLLVIDPYQAFVLRVLAPLSARIPQFDWDRIRVGILDHQIEALERAGLAGVVAEMRQASVASRDLISTPGRYLISVRGNRKNTNLLSAVGREKVEPVWSLWKGYWPRPNCQLRKWCERNDVSVRFIHSGGHAWPQDIDRLISAIEPRQAVAVHTDTRER